MLRFKLLRIQAIGCTSIDLYPRENKTATAQARGVAKQETSHGAAHTHGWRKQNGHGLERTRGRKKPTRRIELRDHQAHSHVIERNSGKLC